MGISTFKVSTCSCSDDDDIRAKQKEKDSLIKSLQQMAKNMKPAPKKGQKVSEEEIKQAFDSCLGKRNYIVLDTRDIGSYTILKLKYSDATNYEGVKILVYENLNKVHVMNGGALDPHFCDGAHVSPIARFVPTDEGWRMALTLCENLSKGWGDY